MVRRRVFRRPPVRGRRTARPQQAALRALRRANRLMEEGAYEQAYPILKRLADGAARHGMPVRAASLYLRAARARLEMGSGQDAVALARRALQLLIAVGQVERVRALLVQMIHALQEKGYNDLAVTLQAEFAALMGGSGDTPSSTPRAMLPIRCPSCNGPIRPDEVDWLDDTSAECIYCGSMIRAQ